MNQRPLSITIIGWLYIATGVGACAVHANGFTARPFPTDVMWAELVSVAAVIAGVYLLRGRDWARWLAMAWIGFHVILSVFHNVPELAIHSLFCAVLAYFLFRASAARYFRRSYS